MHLIDRPTQIS